MSIFTLLFFHGDTGHTCSCPFIGIIIVHSFVVVGGTLGTFCFFNFVLVLGPPGRNVATSIYPVVAPHHVTFNFVVSTASLASNDPAPKVAQHLVSEPDGLARAPFPTPNPLPMKMKPLGGQLSPLENVEATFGNIDDRKRQLRRRRGNLQVAR